MESKHRVGPLMVIIEGTSELASYVRNELSIVPAREGGECDLKQNPVRFVFHQNWEKLKRGDLDIPKSDFRIEGGAIRWHTGLAQIRWNPVDNDASIVIAHRPRLWQRNKAYRFLHRFADWNYLTPVEIAAKHFFYGIFDLVTQLRLLEIGASYIHASGVANKDRAVLISAAGGIGKTTVMLDLVLRQGWRYLSDDLAIIGKNGETYLSPKRMQIYAYNLKGRSLLARRFFAGRSIFDKFSWNVMRTLHGDKGVRRRVSADRLFGTKNIASRTMLNKLFLLERSESSAWSFRDIPSHAPAKICSIILLHELHSYRKCYDNLTQIGQNNLLPSPEDILLRSESVMKNAFYDAHCISVKIPDGAGPDELAKYISERL